MVFNGNVVNFTYLLIEYYKDIGLTEAELSILLMVEHLLSQNNTFVTTAQLALKMNMPQKDIDRVLTDLYKKKLVQIKIVDMVPSTSIDPIKKIVYKKFQDSILLEDQNEHNEEFEETRRIVLNEMENLFGRSLSPVEIDRVNDWITSGTKRTAILDAIKDAKAKKITNINTIDRLIVQKIREEDNFGNAIR